jgi:serine phosphatase RsbU (regulator of sigma subunit)
MRKTALVILIAVSGAALMLFTAATKWHVIVQPHPYAAASWLSAILAFGVFAVMLAQHFTHGRQMYLHLSSAFLSLGIIGIWDALALPNTASSAAREFHLALWQAGWITLAATAIYAAVISRLLGSRRHAELARTGASAVIAASILWAALVIFLISTIPALTRVLTEGDIAVMVACACAALFAIAFAMYSRLSVHKNNAVLLWMAYGLVFSIFAEAAIAMTASGRGNSFFGYAALMKVLAFLSPLGGMLAEHTRLQMRLHEQASDLSNLIQTQQAVVSISAAEDLYRRVTELASFSLSAGAACLMVFDRDRGLLHAAAKSGIDDDAAKRLVFRPSEGPPGDAFSSKETIFVGSIADDPILSQRLDGIYDIGSAAFAPLMVRDECLGVMGVLFGGRPFQKLSKEQHRMLEALTNIAATAVDGVQLRGRMFYSSKASGDYAREMDVVWDIGQAVTSKLELHDLVDTLAEKLGTAVDAKACSVLVFEPDVVGIKIMGHRKLARYNSVDEHVDACDQVAATVARTGKPVIFNDAPNTCFCKYAELSADDGGTHHLLSVPLSTRGFLGAISVFRQNSEPFGEKEKRLLVKLAPMVAAGIRNAELYEREKKIAENLQKSFLPDISPEMHGIQIAHRYRAAYDESLVGGDFYDVLDFGEGRYGVVIGDVAGKGLDAAVYTAMSRYMIQAYSAQDIDPVYVVTKLNEALCRYTPSAKFVTLFYGLLDIEEGVLTYVNAGHELPFVYRNTEDRLETLQTTGPAAGAVQQAEYVDERIPFEPGDMLILYTDGATEVRSEGKFLGTEGLQRLVNGQIRLGVHDLPQGILESVQSYANDYLRDDLAILVVKARTPGSLF